MLRIHKNDPKGLRCARAKELERNVQTWFVGLASCRKLISQIFAHL